MDNAIHAGKHVLVDLGYVNAKATRDRADRLRKHIGRSNFQLAGSNRLLVRIPPTQAVSVLKRFKAIKPAAVAPGYCWCTHSWLDTESVKLEHAQ